MYHKLYKNAIFLVCHLCYNLLVLEDSYTDFHEGQISKRAYLKIPPS